MEIKSRDYDVNEVITTDINNKISFVIQDQTVHYLPKRIYEHLHNIDTIKIFNTGLKEIRKKWDLRFFPNLWHLTISYNEIQYLERDLFDENLMLEVLILDHNQISFIAQETFNMLFGLRTLDLTDNECFDSKAENLNLKDMISFVYDVERGCSRIIELNLKDFNFSIILSMVQTVFIIIVTVIVTVILMKNLKSPKVDSDGESLKMKSTPNRCDEHVASNSIALEVTGYEEPLAHEQNIYEKIDYAKLKAEGLVIIDGVEYMRMDNPNAVEYLDMTRGKNNKNQN